MLGKPLLEKIINNWCCSPDVKASDETVDERSFLVAMLCKVLGFTDHLYRLTREHCHICYKVLIISTDPENVADSRTLLDPAVLDLGGA